MTSFRRDGSSGSDVEKLRGREVEDQQQQQQRRRGGGVIRRVHGRYGCIDTEITIHRYIKVSRVGTLVQHNSQHFA